jgi:hypothetical protein
MVKRTTQQGDHRNVRTSEHTLQKRKLKLESVFFSMSEVMWLAQLPSGFPQSRHSFPITRHAPKWADV